MPKTGMLSLGLVAGLLVGIGTEGNCYAQGTSPGTGTGTGTGGGGTGGGTPGGGTGGTTPGMGTSGRTPTMPSPGQRQEQQMPNFEMQRPLFFSGKVVQQDGTPPPDPAVIELVCNAQPRPQGYTDSKGRFSFQLGNNQGMFADASYSSPDSPFGGSGQDVRTAPSRMPGASRGYSERDLMGCEMRVVLAGYQSQPIQLSGRRLMDNPDLGTIILHRIANVEGYTYSLTTALAPKEARKAYEKGVDQAKKKKMPEALANLQKAVDLYPKYSIAWFQLGQVYEQMQQEDEALKAYNEAIKADSKFVSPYLQLAGIEARNKKWEELAGTTSTIIKLNPYNFPAAYFYNSVANYNLQNTELAEKSAREAVRLDPDHRLPKASHLLGIILAQKQDYPGAAEHLKAYLTARPTAPPDAESVKKQLADVERAMGAKPVAQTPPPQQ